MKTRQIFAAAVLAALAGGAFSQPTSAPLSEAAATASPMTSGEVRKVDKEAGKVTIRHEPLKNLGMPAMTMIFRVRDPDFLAQIKEGDKINFQADRENGLITITAIEVAK